LTSPSQLGDLTAAAAVEAEPRFRVQDYAVLLKLRVMSLVVFTGCVGMLMAPAPVSLETALATVLFIAIGAGSAGAINMWYDRDIDGVMARTKDRPLPAGRLQPQTALAFGLALGIVSVAAMALAVNVVAALLLALTIVYYVFVYTVWLKRRTPQNIVIGGAAGALPPMIGWAAATGDIGLGGIVLFAIIFLWTPPHSWALALFSTGDYDRAGVPMLPVVAGETAARRHILAYTALLVPVSLLPVAIGMSGLAYGIVAGVLGALFVHHAVRVVRGEAQAPKALFLFSILYLFLIFASLVGDRALGTLL
jgi:protoheme IX farnesyltransferase